MNADLSGIHERTYYVTPNHLVTLAAWFRIFDFSLVSMRALSILWGVVVLLAMYSIVSRLFPDRWVAPLAALLPAGALKVRFYVAESERAGLVLGDPVAISCDGCGDTPLAAKLSYFASEPQFTPPVIYSREERNRLTFLAEATLDPGATLLPGQPVTVSRQQ